MQPNDFSNQFKTVVNLHGGQFYADVGFDDPSDPAVFFNKHEVTYDIPKTDYERIVSLAEHYHAQDESDDTCEVCRHGTYNLLGSYHPPGSRLTYQCDICGDYKFVDTEYDGL